MQLCQIQQFARRAVRLGRILYDFSLIADNVGYQPRQVGNADFFSAADIHNFVIVVGLHKIQAGVGHIVNMEKFAQGGACAPDADFRGLRQTRFMEAAQQGGQHMRVFRMEIILRTVQIGRHDGYGGKAVLLRGNSPQAIFDAVSREKCTIVWLLVPWAQDILAALDRGTLKIEDYQLSQWRLMHIGAQPVPPSLVKHWLQYFPHHQYDTNYGLSESTGPGCVHLGMENPHKVGAIGIPGYGWETKIVDEKGQPVSQGQVGELCVKGSGVMLCYYHDPKATAEVLQDGWLHTGDMAQQDEDGFIFLVDRKKDVIISGGENLYPVQIESFLAAHPKIHDVAVIGLPDQRLGEIAAAIIQVKDGMTCTEDEINDFCMDLPRYKRPRKLIFADVPRNATGKIEKPVLRERYCGVRLVEAQNQA